MTRPTLPLTSENHIEDDDDIILLTEEIPPAQHNDMIEIRQLADRSEPTELPNLSEIPKEEPAFIDLTDAIEPTDFKLELPSDFSVTEDDILNIEMEDPRFSASVLPEDEPLTESIFSLEPLPQIHDTEDRQDSLNSDGEDIVIEEISSLTIENDFSQLHELLSETPPTIPSLSSDTPHISASEAPPDELQRLINDVVHDSQVPPQDFSGILPHIDIPEEPLIVAETFPVGTEAHPVVVAETTPVIDAVPPVMVEVPPVVAEISPVRVAEPPVIADQQTALSSPDQIDAAVERVVRNLFDEKIEPILNEIVSTAVHHEIENLKTVFLEYLASGKTNLKG
jgi:hypothetical protein